MDREAVAITVAMAIVAGLILVWGISILVTSESDRNDCVATYEVCIDTTDGWKPYVASEES